MIICSNCKHQEYLGALFCSECGAQIVFKRGVETDSLRLGTDSFLDDQKAPDKTLESPVHIHDAVITLLFPETEQVMPLAGKDEFTIGRISKGQVMYPDVDLTEMSGYEKGVSRIHASINIKKSSVFITDLGSSNGTRVNGVLIAPHSPHIIENGDKVALGKLRIDAVIRR